MTKAEIINKLKTGVHTFYYWKGKDMARKERRAFGTLDKSRFVYDAKGGAKLSDHLVGYWDLEKEEFRSFKLENFIRFAT